MSVVPPAKRPLTERFLSLRSPRSGTIGQGIRYALAGGTVAVVYLATTTVLANVVGLPFQLALAIGYVTGLCVHFTLQRVFVWVHDSEFALGIGEQAGRYLLVAGAQYGITALSTSVLPRWLGVPVIPVYFVTAISLTVVNFLIFRGGVFHAEH